MDDLKGRRYAENLGLSITGSLGILIEAKLQGIMNSIAPALEKMRSTNFRLTEELETYALMKSGEIL